MIRDEFLKQQQEKNLSSKEMDRIRKMGERSFYTGEVNRLTNLKKTFNLSSIIVGVLLVLVTAVMLIAWIATGVFVKSFILPLAIVVGFWVLLLGWFIFFRPSVNKKIVKYKQILDNIRKESLDRQRKIYDNLKK
jgi:fatty acid desaturase